MPQRYNKKAVERLRRKIRDKSSRPPMNRKKKTYEQSRRDGC